MGTVFSRVKILRILPNFQNLCYPVRIRILNHIGCRVGVGKAPPLSYFCDNPFSLIEGKEGAEGTSAIRKIFQIIPNFLMAYLFWSYRLYILGKSPPCCELDEEKLSGNLWRWRRGKRTKIDTQKSEAIRRLSMLTFQLYMLTIVHTHPMKLDWKIPIQGTMIHSYIYVHV